MRVVAEHHEHWDGAGYPAGPRGTEIELKARVVAIADAFDAMTSARAYRPAMSYEAARAESERCASAEFDPQVVGTFGRVAQACIEGIARRTR